MNENSAVGKKFAINVGIGERLTSVIAGALLFIDAVKKRDHLTTTKAAIGGYLLFRGATGHCNLYDIAGIAHRPDPVKNINIRTTLFINKPRQEVYAFWRDLNNLPLFMEHLKSVKTQGKKKSKWKAWLPGRLGTIGWKAKIVKDKPGKFLGWNSLPGSTIDNAGKIEFKNAGTGTELRVFISYRAPLGILGAGLANLFTPAFKKIIIDDIQNFKTYLEAEDNTTKTLIAEA